MEILERNIKVTLVGDARVGKTNWVNMGIDGEDTDDYIPTMNYQSRLRAFSSSFFDDWWFTPQDRAKWIEDSDAAIIMVDLANQESINNTILWYREIISFQQHSDNLKHLPIMIFGYKAYEDDAKYKIKPTEISWPEEMGSTPFHYNEYLGEHENWMTDKTEYYEGFIVHYPPAPDSGYWNAPSPGTLEKWKREMEEACKLPMPEDSDVEL
ncbi:hypothetical protein N7509_003165 [Penicillium cosmopolitanum]|uniref:Uncharacterized protein n=1 Tax=Penicillium cosmopolitanum TaxID=1131564 RepID=A0A9W9W4F4_9EURO|nr:uncharacterized protein N7509_003165 [Penicillium cosmopolitanum]KAJ5403294.1 hypothetical protein N7509_003165 [Penicillium cosmopolitanum]